MLLTAPLRAQCAQFCRVASPPDRARARAHLAPLCVGVHLPIRDAARCCCKELVPRQWAGERRQGGPCARTAAAAAAPPAAAPDPHAAANELAAAWVARHGAGMPRALGDYHLQ